MALTEEQETQMRQDHRIKYAAICKDRGLAITNLNLFGVKDMEELQAKLAEDEHLNNIPLKRFDALTALYNVHNPRSRMSLAEGCCAYKELLKQMVETI